MTQITRHGGQVCFQCSVSSSLNLLVYLLPVNRHLFGRGDPESDLVAFELQDGNLNVVTDVKGLSCSPCEYQHCLRSPLLLLVGTGILSQGPLKKPHPSV